MYYGTSTERFYVANMGFLVVGPVYTISRNTDADLHPLHPGLVTLRGWRGRRAGKAKSVCCFSGSDCFHLSCSSLCLKVIWELVQEKALVWDEDQEGGEKNHMYRRAFGSVLVLQLLSQHELSNTNKSCHTLETSKLWNNLHWCTHTVLIHRVPEWTAELFSTNLRVGNRMGRAIPSHALINFMIWQSK